MFINKKTWGALAVCFAASFWAFEAVVLTPFLYNLPTLFVVFMLYFIPFLLMQPFFLKQYKSLNTFSSKDLFSFFLLALLGGVLGTTFITKALFLLNFRQLTIVALLQKLQPIFALILAHFVLKEKIPLKTWGWIFLALTGSYFLTFGNQLPDFEGVVTQAAVLAILAAFCYGAQTVLGKNMMNKANPITGTFFRLFFTVLILGTYLIAKGDLFSNFSKITALNWQIFFLIGISSSGIVLPLYYFGLKNIPASLATFCEMCFVISSIGLDFFVHHSFLHPIQILGAVLLIFVIGKISMDQTKK